MTTTDLSRVGAALAAPGRARMIERLFDGQEHTAGELAEAAGVASGTASEHLGVLVEAGLVTVRRDGRYRRCRLADAAVATALEALSRETSAPVVTSYRLSAEQRRVRLARTCYDHLAGRLGVAVHEVVATRGWLQPAGAALTAGGRTGLAGWGVDLEAVDRSRRPAVLTCVDWTERRPHLAGAVGAALADLALARAWVRRVGHSRALLITPEGTRAFVDDLGVPPEVWRVPGAR